MTTYKYTDSTNTVVHIIDDDGISRRSMLSEALPEGTEILPADVYVPPIPSIVSMRQARLALYDANLLHLVDETISLMPITEQREKSKIEWEYATEVKRDSALVYGLAGGLGLTDSMLDELFVKAATL